MMDTYDGLSFVDLGMCVVVQIGHQALGITHEEFFELTDADPDRRKELLAQWLRDSIPG